MVRNLDILIPRYSFYVEIVEEALILYSRIQYYDVSANTLRRFLVPAKSIDSQTE